jgi:hypothetical protein
VAPGASCKMDQPREASAGRGIALTNDSPIEVWPNL